MQTPVDSPNLVFVMGSHRSGTTWLQQLIAGTGELDYLSAYHVINFERLAELPRDPREGTAYEELATKLASLESRTRVIDEIAISPDLPEEYGFLFARRGLGNAFTVRASATLREVSMRVSTSPDRGVVLKNAYDYPHFLALKKAFPRARFVFIHRHPERVIHSLLSTLRAALGERIPYLTLLLPSYQELFTGSWPKRLFRRLALYLSQGRSGVWLARVALARAHRRYLRDIGRLPPESQLSIRYEDLCERPRATFTRVLEFLKLDPAHADALSVESRPRHGALLPEVEARRGAIARELAPYMARHGYLPEKA